MFLQTFTKNSMEGASNNETFRKMAKLMPERIMATEIPCIYEEGVLGKLKPHGA